MQNMLRKDSRYAMPKEKRKFGGHIYGYLEWARTKKEAQARADRCKNGRAGCIGAVITPYKNGYAIYARFGKK
jgi:hypothetical protein